jgi:hypothetical protein
VTSEWWWIDEDKQSGTHRRANSGDLTFLFKGSRLMTYFGPNNITCPSLEKVYEQCDVFRMQLTHETECRIMTRSSGLESRNVGRLSQHSCGFSSQLIERTFFLVLFNGLGNQHVCLKAYDNCLKDMSSDDVFTAVEMGCDVLYSFRCCLTFRINVSLRPSRLIRLQPSTD